MNRTFRRIAVIVIVVGCLAGLAWYLTRPERVVVVLATVGAGRVEASVANTRAGTVKAERRARLAPSVGGQVARLLVTEGQRVTTGELLLELWNEDLEAKVKLAESELAAARARHEESCQIAMSAEREAKRLLQLQAAGVESDERVDVVVADAKAKRAACDAVAANVQVSESRIAVVRATLEQTRLRAPFDGVVAEANTEVGEFVTPSPPGIPTEPAIDLIDDGSLFVLAPIDEVDAPEVRIGLKSRVTMDAFPEREFDGTVRRVAPYISEREKRARTVDVEVDLAAAPTNPRFLVGYSADIEIILEVREGVVRVPTEALLEGHRVLVFREEDGRLEERTLEVGISNWRFTEVRKGLEPGERVVVSLERAGVVPGARAVPEKAAASTDSY